MIFLVFSIFENFLKNDFLVPNLIMAYRYLLLKSRYLRQFKIDFYFAKKFQKLARVKKQRADWERMEANGKVVKKWYKYEPKASLEEERKKKKPAKKRLETPEKKQKKKPSRNMKPKMKVSVKQKKRSTKPKKPSKKKATRRNSADSKRGKK